MPLHVIGDSKLILTQLQMHRPPRSDKLMPLDSTARHLANRCGVDTWSHHYRRHNKMLDILANAAKDARESAQDDWPTANTLLHGTEEWLQNDV
ncbi:hypothetical protein PybrP1_001530, partial [[Pythium] brassicae (nom. inval.)]